MGVYVCDTTWEDRLRELADYRKTHGHCNVPRNRSEYTKLAGWVGKQRYQYNGKKPQMTLSRIWELESLGIEWSIRRPIIVKHTKSPKDHQS
jgi:hypothetical protein